MPNIIACQKRTRQQKYEKIPAKSIHAEDLASHHPLNSVKIAWMKKTVSYPIGIIYALLTIALPTSISGMQGAMVLLLIAVILLFTWSSAFRESVSSFPLWILLLLILAAPLPSFLNSMSIDMSIRWYRRHLYMIAIPIIALTTQFAGKHGLRLITTYVLVSTLASVYAILQVFLGKNLDQALNLKTYYVHASAFFSMPNTLAEVLTFAFFASLVLIKLKSGKYWKTLLIVCCLTIFWAILMTRTRTPSVVVAVIGSAYAIYLFRKRALLVAGLIATLLMAIALNNSRVFWRFQSFDRIQTHRFRLWSYAMDAFLEHPITGIGIGTFDYYLNEKTPEKEKYLTRYDHAHNNILDTAATTGIIGLLALLLFWGKVLVDLIHSFLREIDPVWKTIWLAMFLAIVAFHLEGLTECTLKDTEVAIQLYTVTGLYYGITQYRRRNENGSP